MDNNTSSMADGNESARQVLFNYDAACDLLDGQRLENPDLRSIAHFDTVRIAPSGNLKNCLDALALSQSIHRQRDPDYDNSEQALFDSTLYMAVSGITRIHHTIEQQNAAQVAAEQVEAEKRKKILKLTGKILIPILGFAATVGAIGLWLAKKTEQSNYITKPAVERKAPSFAVGQNSITRVEAENINATFLDKQIATLTPEKLEECANKYANSSTQDFTPGAIMLLDEKKFPHHFCATSEAGKLPFTALTVSHDKPTKANKSTKTIGSTQNSDTGVVYKIESAFVTQPIGTNQDVQPLIGKGTDLTAAADASYHLTQRYMTVRAKVTIGADGQKQMTFTNEDGSPYVAQPVHPPAGTKASAANSHPAPP